jgi:hypothetical protein
VKRLCRCDMLHLVRGPPPGSLQRRAVAWGVPFGKPPIAGWGLQDRVDAGPACGAPREGDGPWWLLAVRGPRGHICPLCKWVSFN